MSVEAVDLLRTALFMVQLPVLAVTQLAIPPGEKLPLTVAFATNEEFISRIVTVA